jgi:hypothetical protein
MWAASGGENLGPHRGWSIALLAADNEYLARTGKEQGLLAEPAEGRAGRRHRADCSETLRGARFFSWRSNLRPVPALIRHERKVRNYEA